MADYIKLLQYILQLPASTAYILLKSCINLKSIHHIFTVNRALTTDYINAFNDLMDRCLHKRIKPYATVDIRQTLAKVQDFEDLLIQRGLVRSLSVNEGDLGIRKRSKINGAAWTASNLKSFRWLTRTTFPLS